MTSNKIIKNIKIKLQRYQVFIRKSKVLCLVNKMLNIFYFFLDDFEEIKQDISSFRYEMINTSTLREKEYAHLMQKLNQILGYKSPTQQESDPDVGQYRDDISSEMSVSVDQELEKGEQHHKRLPISQMSINEEDSRELEDNNQIVCQADINVETVIEESSSSNLIDEASSSNLNTEIGQSNVTTEVPENM